MIYKAYNSNFLPLVGSLIAKDDSSYRYLVIFVKLKAESIELFHDQDTLL